MKIGDVIRVVGLALIDIIILSGVIFGGRYIGEIISKYECLRLPSVLGIISCGIIGFSIILAIDSLLYPLKQNRFIPNIKVLISNDFGKTYTESIKAINAGEDFYLKFEIEVKAKGIFWKLWNNIIPVDIKYPEYFTIQTKKNSQPLKYKCSYYDFTGDLYISKTKNKAYKHYHVSVEDENKKVNLYHVSISDCPGRGFAFSAIASNKPKRSEIIFKIQSGNLETNKVNKNEIVQFEIKFGKQIHPVYSKTISLEFTDSYTLNLAPGTGSYRARTQFAQATHFCERVPNRADVW
jgi:hypothetical protein